jgi:putative transposase
LVDTQGLVLEARVNSAKVVDQDGIKLLLRLSLSDRLSRLCYLWLDTSLHRPGGQGSRLGGEDTGVDGRDRTPPAQAGPHGGDDAVGSGVRNRGLGHRSEEIHLGARPFLPRRWVVERTFSWLGHNRRMSKDYERLPESAEAFIYGSYEPPDGEAFGTLMRVFRQFL